MELYRPIVRGSVSNSIFVEMHDAATPFLPKTGLAFDTVGLVLSYCKKRAARVAITPVTLAAVTTSFTSGGVKEINATNQPGLYRIDVPDAAFQDDGISECIIVTVVCTGYETKNIVIPLLDKADVYVSPGTTRTNN